ncbi:MAG TPA: flagellar assembly protein FliW [Candidatus Deferrimicrobium sp.]|nr:flagellar assembly protein FliW [Candidatus Deferrimicrobium sp.]
MRVSTVRFGELRISEDKLIRMQKPILGFEQLSVYVLVQQDEFQPFHWLQSVEDPAIAFAVVNPAVLFPGYRIEVHSKEVEELMIGDPDQVETYVVVTIPDDPLQMTANLQGPILVNTENHLAKQLVLINSVYEPAHRIVDALKKTEIVAERAPEELVGV